MRTKFLATLASLFISLINFAQSSNADLPSVIPPSPSVSSLMRFEEVPVNNYSGQPDISVPLFTKPINKDLNISVSLRYTTLGIRVDERSSWVGSGWAFGVGGVISRNVKDYPDEINTILYPELGITNDYAIGVYHNDDFWNYQNLSGNDKMEFNWNARSTSKNNFYGNLDNELDVYQFSFLGKSGRFIIVKENGVLVPKLLSNKERFKIEIDYDLLTYKINYFVITDALGYKYKFEEKEFSKAVPITTSTLQNGEQIGIDINSYYYISHTSAWKLTQIMTSNDIELVSFQYQQVVEQFQTARTKTENYNPNLYSNAEIFTNIYGGYNASVLRPRTSFSFYDMDIQSKKISKVIFKDGASIDFVLGGDHPEYTAKKLGDIIIKDKSNTENKRFTFSYITYNRLFLDKIDEIANGQINTTSFTYLSPQSLPGYNGAKNQFGYYDQGIYETRTGLLNKIIFPTKGSKEFIFEQNTVSHEGERLLTTDDFLENPDNLIGRQQITTFNSSLSNPTNQSIFLTFDHDQVISIDTEILSGDPEHLALFNFILADSKGIVIRYIDLGEDVPQISVSSGVYTLKIWAEPYIGSGNDSVSCRAYVNYSDLVGGTLNEYVYGVGNRIKEINFYDEGISTPEKSITFNYNLFATPQRSSGSVDGFLNQSRLFSLTDNNYISSASGVSSVSHSYDITQHLNQIDVLTSNGNYVVYKNVEVSETDNGKRRYEYRSPIDKQSFPVNYVYPFLPFHDIGHEHGVLLKEEVYDSQNKILKETTYDYDFTNDIIAQSRLIFQSGNICNWEQFSTTWQDYNSSSPASNAPPNGGSLLNSCIGYTSIGNLSYDHNSGRSFLKTINTKDYFYGGTTNIVENRQEFIYNTENFQQKEISRYVNEGGVEQYYKTELFYPIGGYPSSEYTSAEISDIAKMVTINKVNIPIYTKQYLNNNLTIKTQSIYNNFYTDVLELKELKTGKGTNANENRITYHSYYNNGNVKEISKENGGHVVYIWGYDETLPIAMIENATYSEVSSQISNIQDKSNLDDDYCMDSGTCDEKNLRTALNNLRNSLPNALVTTYTFNPIIGVTSVTDPKGYTLYYEYDDFSRLAYIKDASGKIVSKNEYHYKN